MSNITKHDTEQEWESNNSKDCWVYFLIHWDTIGVNDLLESISELIRFDISRWGNWMILKSLEIGCGIVW